MSTNSRDETITAIVVSQLRKHSAFDSAVTMRVIAECRDAYLTTHEREADTRSPLDIVDGFLDALRQERLIHSNPTYDEVEVMLGVCTLLRNRGVISLDVADGDLRSTVEARVKNSRRRREEPTEKGASVDEMQLADVDARTEVELPKATQDAARRANALQRAKVLLQQLEGLIAEHESPSPGGDPTVTLGSPGSPRDAAGPSDFIDKHVALDERLIGYLAFDSQTRTTAGVDGCMVVCSTERVMKEWLSANSSIKHAECDVQSYADINADMHEEGISILLDSESLQRYNAARSEDLRFVPATEMWTSESGTMLQPVFHVYRDEIVDIRKQMNSFVLGYSSSLPQGSVSVPSSTVRIRWRPDPVVGSATMEPRPLTYGDFVALEANKATFDFDETVLGRILYLKELNEFWKLYED